MKVDFGCSDVKKEGYFGIDVYAYPGVDLVYDGKHIPLEDNVADEIFSSHTLEHVEDFTGTLKELYRISKDGCLWYIRTPHASSAKGIGMADHLRTLNSLTFDNYNALHSHRMYPEIARGSIDIEKISFSLNWWINYMITPKVWWKRIILRTLDGILSGLANIHPFFCERIWCYYVGGFDEICYVLKVHKPQRQHAGR